MSNDTTTDPALDEFLGAKPARPWRKWAVRGAIGIGLLLLVLLVSRCFAGEDQPSYATREVRQGDLTVSVSATGNLRPVNQVDPSNADATKLGVDAGDFDRRQRHLIWSVGRPSREQAPAHVLWAARRSHEWLPAVVEMHEGDHPYM